MGKRRDIVLRFFDGEGRHLVAEFDSRVVGISAEQFRTIPRRVAAAGGHPKGSAIRAALLGNWVNVLLTDVETARALVS